MTCTCPDFKLGMERINGPIVFQQIRSEAMRKLMSVPGYFKPWTFCPWCGNRLIPEPQSVGSQR